MCPVHVAKRTMFFKIHPKHASREKKDIKTMMMINKLYVIEAPSCTKVGSLARN
uniref:Uncharacterized protein n=1 Tax=Octopus bimaculoides TaxID=37653 RepID=A0A0L8HMX1_OCTBM